MRISDWSSDVCSSDLEQHRDLLADTHVNAIGLRDEEHRESAIHHRAVEIEAVAQRQDKGDDAPVDALLLELLHRLRIGGFRAGGRKGEEDRKSTRLNSSH